MSDSSDGRSQESEQKETSYPPPVPNSRRVSDMLAEGEVSSWLLISLDRYHQAEFRPSTSFAPLTYDGQEAPDFLSSVADSLDPTMREKLKREVVKAIEDWRLPYHFAVLEDLAQTALNVGATDAVVAMRGQIVAGSIAGNDPRSAERTVAKLIGIIGGFPTADRARDTLQELSSRPELAQNYSGNFLLALVRHDPNNFPTYLKDFFRFQDWHTRHRPPTYTRNVLRRFAREVGWDNVFRRLHEAGRQVVDQFVRHIGWDEIGEQSTDCTPEALSSFVSQAVTVPYLLKIASSQSTPRTKNLLFYLPFRLNLAHGQYNRSGDSIAVTVPGLDTPKSFTGGRDVLALQLAMGHYASDIFGEYGSYESTCIEIIESAHRASQKG